MTLRTPTAYNCFNDLSQIKPNGEILAAHQNAVLDDQQFVLDRGECIISTVFYPRGTNSSSWTVLGRLTVAGRHMCGTIPTGADSLDVHIFAWWVGVANDFSVGLYDPNDGSWKYVDVTTDRTSKLWRVSDTVTSNTDGTPTEYQIGAKVNAPYGAGSVYVAGVGVFAPNP